MRRPSRTAKRSLVVRRLQRAVPAGGVDADRPDLDAMRRGVAHDLGRRVEAHRLGVEQAAQNTSGCQHFSQDEA